MKTTIQELDNQFVVSLEGELDTAAALETQQTLQPLYKSNGKDVLIECEKLEYISSSGLRLFLALLKVAKSKGSKVSISGMNDNLRQVFAMTGFTHLFEFI